MEGVRAQTHISLNRLGWVHWGGVERAPHARPTGKKKKKKEKKKKRILQTDRRLVPGKNAPARKISCLGLSSRASYEKF